MDSYSFSKARLVTSAGASRPETLYVEDGVIGDPKGAGKALSVPMGNDSFLYPALINVHDHLRGNYLPRVGPKGDSFYVNWSYWDNDLKTSDVFKERANITIEQMYFLGSYKNLFSGVVTVNDHFPHEINAPFVPRLPVRAIEAYGLAHECSSFDLKWGRGMKVEHDEARAKGWPFITHLEEGFDPETQSGVEILERDACLDDGTLLIHCIGFSDEDIARVAKARASVAWCPGSNVFMFNVTCKIKKMLEAGINVALGTDSTHTGCANLLEEIRFARETYRKLYGEDLAPKTIFSMVTENPARAFRMQDSVGSLDRGKRADLLALRARDGDPHENLALARMEDIELLVRDGVAVYGEARFAELCPPGATDYTWIKVGGRQMFVKGDPAGLLRAVRKATGVGKKRLEYLPFDA